MLNSEHMHISFISANGVRQPSELPDGADIMSQYGLHSLPIPSIAAMAAAQGISGPPQELLSILHKAVEEKKDKETVMLELNAMKEAMMKHAGTGESLYYIQSNLGNSNIFVTMWIICLRHG